MKKFMVLSGFLGAGKTTLMIALSGYLNARGTRTALIANDLGARDLVDTKFMQRQGCDATELAGECICYQTENLVDRLRRLFDYEKSGLVISDIPGCGVGALEHVYHKLDREYPGEFSLAPFTVVADPARLRAIMPERADVRLPREMDYLFRAQLLEADTIVLNKIDTVGERERAAYLAFLRALCPDAKVFAASAKTGEGIEPLAAYLLAQAASMRSPEVGYGGAEFCAAEEKLCWYNRQYYVRVCCDTFDPDAYLAALAAFIRDRLRAEARNVPHLKLYAETESGAAKLSMVGIDAPAEVDSRIGQPCVDLPVIINARAACESALFTRIVDEAMQETGRQFQLECMVFFTECFGMMDEGRL